MKMRRVEEGISCLHKAILQEMMHIFILFCGDQCHAKNLDNFCKLMNAFLESQFQITFFNFEESVLHSRDKIGSLNPFSDLLLSVHASSQKSFVKEKSKKRFISK